MALRLCKTSLTLAVLLTLSLVSALAPARAQTPLPVNGSVSGSLGDSNPLDQYSITFTQDGDLALNLSPSSTLSTRLRFWDSDGTTLIAEVYANPGNASSLTIPHLGPPTTYFVTVERTSGTSGSYTLSDTFTPPTEANDAENNDTPGTGVPYDLNAGTMTGHGGYSRSAYNDRDNIDYYKFTIPADGNLKLDLHPDSTLSTRLRFWDSDGTTLIAEVYANPGNDSTLTIPHLGPPTTYFVTVEPTSGTYGGYTLDAVLIQQTITNDTENNDTPASGETFPVNGTVTGHSGYSRTAFNDRDNIDYFKFTASQDGDATFTLTPDSTLSTRLRFWDSDGTTLIAEVYANPGNASSLTIPHLGPGTTYFVTVEPTSGTYGGYTLNNSLTTPTESNDSEPNDTPGSGSAFAINSTVTGHSGYSRSAYNDRDSIDYYKFTVPADGDVKFTLTPDSTLSTRLRFWDSDGTTLIAEVYANPGNASSLTIPHLGPGATYFVTVEPTSGTYGGYTLSNSLTTPAEANDTEKNDTPQTAKKTLAATGTTTGHAGYSRTAYNDRDSIDYYKFKAPADGDLVLTLQPDSTLSTRLRFWDSDGTTLIAEVYANPGNASSLTIPHLGKPGVYFVTVEPTSGTYGGYTLKTKFNKQKTPNDVEKNDTPQTAIAFAINTIASGHSGYSRKAFNDRDNIDYRKFTFNGGTIEFFLRPTSTLSTRLRVWNTDGVSLLAEVYANPGNNSALSVTLNAAGTYFVSVEPTSGTYGGYRLSNSFNVALSSLTLSPTTVKGGAKTTNNVVTLTGPAPSTGAVVSLSSDNSAVAQPVDSAGNPINSVTVPPGTFSVKFRIKTFKVTTTTTVNISASFGGVTKTAALTVTP